MAAARDADRIYAVIRGIGTSSDGRAKSIYAPSPAGQAKALRRAYAAAGYGPDTVGLVEAHGTGTKAGDAAEFSALREVFQESGREDHQWCALGSVKSQVGHTKGAAGACGLFKTVMALHHRALPPTIKVEQPNPALDIERTPFYLSTRTKPWIADNGVPRRASVSSFGFGGTNFHVTVEEYTGSGRRAFRYRSWDSELVVLGAGLGEGAARWIRAARGRTDDTLRIVTLDVDAAPVADGIFRGPRRAFRSLLADALAAVRSPIVRKRAAPTRRVPMAPREPIFVASQVASLWGVDLKTVHGWVESGDVEAFRTPGGHLRFRRRALLDLLRRFHMPIPTSLGPRRPMVLAVVPDAATVAELALSLGDAFDLISRVDPMEALAEIGTLSAGAGMLDAVVVALPVPGLDDQRWIRAVRSHPDTKYGRVVVLGGDAAQQRSWQALGVAATLDAGRTNLVRTVLERALGIG